MSWRYLLFLAALGLGVYLLVAVFQHTPGYMDAEYYFAGGLRLAGGNGFSEPFIWNYLDNPPGLPHPSHTYWMPLASLVAYLGIRLSGSAEFPVARWGFILAAACVPVLSAILAYRFNLRRDAALLAGFLAVFSPFYLPYLPTSDTFGLVMLLGGLWLLTAQRPIYLRSGESGDLSPLLLGLLSGLMHLARADGVIWLGAALLAAVWLPVPTPGRSQQRFSRVLATLLGYLLIMGPWLLRNQALFGSLLAPGGGKALWFVEYDDLYAFPGALITPARWWASGLGQILHARAWGLGQNLQTLLAVQLSIFLAPLVVTGLWFLRRERSVRLGVLIWLSILLVMTLLFPYAGARGGFFHSGAGVQPLFWACVPAGLDAFVAWGSRKRGWQAAQARRVFQVGLIIFALASSFFVFSGRVIGANWRQPAWDSPSVSYAALAERLAKSGVGQNEIIMVNNPPGFYLASGRMAVAIPNGSVDTLLAAARQYGAGYVVLEANHPTSLAFLYEHPGDQPGLRYVTTVDGAHLFEVNLD